MLFAVTCLLDVKRFFCFCIHASLLADCFHLKLLMKPSYPILFQNYLLGISLERHTLSIRCGMCDRKYGTTNVVGSAYIASTVLDSYVAVKFYMVLSTPIITLLLCQDSVGAARL